MGRTPQEGKASEHRRPRVLLRLGLSGSDPAAPKHPLLGGPPPPPPPRRWQKMPAPVMPAAGAAALFLGAVVSCSPQSPTLCGRRQGSGPSPGHGGAEEAVGSKQQQLSSSASWGRALKGVHPPPPPPPPLLPPRECRVQGLPPSLRLPPRPFWTSWPCWAASPNWLCPWLQLAPCSSSLLPPLQRGKCGQGE